MFNTGCSVRFGMVLGYLLCGWKSRMAYQRQRKYPEVGCRNGIRPEPGIVPWGTPLGQWWCCRLQASRCALPWHSAATHPHFHSPVGTGSSETGHSDSSLPAAQNASGCSYPEWPAEWGWWSTERKKRSGWRKGAGAKFVLLCICQEEVRATVQGFSILWWARGIFNADILVSQVCNKKTKDLKHVIMLAHFMEDQF